MVEKSSRSTGGGKPAGDCVARAAAAGDVVGAAEAAAAGRKPEGAFFGRTPPIPGADVGAGAAVAVGVGRAPVPPNSIAAILSLSTL